MQVAPPWWGQKRLWRCLCVQNWVETLVGCSDLLLGPGKAWLKQLGNGAILSQLINALVREGSTFLLAPPPDASCPPHEAIAASRLHAFVEAASFLGCPRPVLPDVFKILQCAYGPAPDDVVDAVSDSLCLCLETLAMQACQGRAPFRPNIPAISETSTQQIEAVASRLTTPSVSTAAIAKLALGPKDEEVVEIPFGDQGDDEQDSQSLISRSRSLTITKSSSASMTAILRASRREETARELLYSERDCVRSLDVVVGVYIALDGMELISSSDTATMFHEIEKLLTIHRSILKALEDSLQRVVAEADTKSTKHFSSEALPFPIPDTPLADEREGGPWVRLAHIAPLALEQGTTQLRPVLQTYSANYANACTVVQKAREEIPAFADFADCEGQPDARGRSLIELLAIPIRRVQDYVALTQALRANADEVMSGPARRAEAASQLTARACGRAELGGRASRRVGRKLNTASMSIHLMQQQQLEGLQQQYRERAHGQRAVKPRQKAAEAQSCSCDALRAEVKQLRDVAEDLMETLKMAVDAVDVERRRGDELEAKLARRSETLVLLAAKLRELK